MEFLKTYFKTRGLRQITQWLVIAAVSILSLSFFAVADAYAQAEISTCNGANLEGQATANAVLPNTNSLDFDDAPTTDFEKYRAELCPYNPANSYLEIKGWVWNQNLGWISLYCKDGKNSDASFGLACGDFDYGVKIDKATGNMYGWAWGDNVGWVSFGCGADHKNEGADCGNVVYSGHMNLVVNKNLGDTSGFVWADTVGWFDISKVNSFILPVVVPISDTESNAGLWTKVENNEGADRNAVPDKNTAPVADGSESYDVFVNLADFNGLQLDLSGAIGLTGTISTTWEDNVQFDQTITVGGPGYLDPEVLKNENIGPVTKAGIGTNTFADTGKNPTGGSTNTLTASVKSKAPVGLNCYDNNDGSCTDDDDDFYYHNFGVNVPASALRYTGATVDLHLVHESGEVEDLSSVLPPLNGFEWLNFTPAYELTTFNYLLDATNAASGVNYIESFRNKTDYFDIGHTKRSGAIPNPTVDLHLKTGVEGVDYGWLANVTDEAPGVPDTLYNTPGTHFAFPYAPMEEGDEGSALLAGKIEGAKAYSVVQYTLGNTIKYFSNGLPRITDSSIINQSIVLLSGQLYSQGAIQVSESDIVESIGDLADGGLRTSILRNVSGITSGLESADLGGAEVEFNAGSPYRELDGGYAYYYKNADVTINDLSWLSGLGHPVTLIVEGDVYINTNINSPDPVDPGSAPGSDFGLIVFEKESYTDENDRGGRIYLHSDVTDLVNVFIYADHAMFRYKEGICFFTDAYGPGLNLLGQKEPNFVKNDRCLGFMEPTTTLVNQLYIKGVVSSENCVGCSTLLPLNRGDGQLLGPPTPDNFAIARLYDFNYLTYFRQKTDGNLSGVQSKSILQRETAPLTMLSPVYFDYTKPPADLSGFNQ